MKNSKNLQPILGYTLVELLVVIAIMAVISAIGIYAHQKNLSFARDKDAQTSVRMVASSQETYKSINGKYFYSSGSGSDICHANPSSTNEVATSLLKGIALNSKYFYYCVYGDPSVASPTFTALAVEIATGRKFAVDQDGATSYCEPSPTPPCNPSNRASSF